MIEVNDIVALHDGKLIRVYRIDGDWIIDRNNLGYHKEEVELYYKPYKPSLKFRQEEVRRCAEKWGVEIKFLDGEE